MSSAYLDAGERRAHELGNRGPMRFDDSGCVHQDILDAYGRTGFYVFENILQASEVAQLTAEFEEILERAPTGSEATTDAHGRLAIGGDLARPSFRFAKPLSDPNGGTASTHGRYPAKMSEPAVPQHAPEEVLYNIGGVLNLMDSALYLYGHPSLLKVAAAINGDDFVPFTDTIWVKPAGLGASVAWHQDGTTHWDNPELAAGTHGFNFMTQLYDTNPQSALWVVPGTHDEGKIDISARMRDNDGSDQLPDAVPMLAKSGDIAICNRQALHGSFANTSDAPRATLVFGFHPRASVENVKGWADRPYDEAQIAARARIISLAVDARAQQYPDEARFVYSPLAHETTLWQGREDDTTLRNYNLNDLRI